MPNIYNMGVLSVYFIIPSDMNSSYYNAFLKSITFYAVPLVNKSQTTINGKQMLVFKSNDMLIEKLDPVDIIYYTSIGYSLDAIKIQWDDTVILDALNADNDIKIKFEIQKYYTSNVFTQLTKIELPQGLKTMGTIVTSFSDLLNDTAFSLALSDLITEIIIPDTVETIGDLAFSSNNLNSTIIPPSVKRIGHGAFIDSKNIKELIIPNSVTEMGAFCFNRCASLEKIKIGNGIERLEHFPRIGYGNFAIFGNCPLLKEIIFGKNINYIDSYTFVNCPLIEFIAFPSENVEIKGEQFITVYDDMGIISYDNNGNNIGTNFTNPTGPPYKATILTVDSDRNPDTKLTFLNPIYAEKTYYNYILLNKYPSDITIPKITREFLEKKAKCYIEAETVCESKELKNKCYRKKIKKCLTDYMDEGFQTELNDGTVYNNIYAVLGLIISVLIGLQIMRKYRVLSDIILNSASLLLLSAGLIYSIVLYQHLEEAESKKVLALNKDIVKVDVPKPAAKSKDLLESKPVSYTHLRAHET
jgi:hypothetical protein